MYKSNAISFSITRVLLLAFAFMAAHISSGQNCNCPAYYVNGGFEDPDIGSGYQIMSQSNVPGWSTTAGDKKIELWHDGFNGFDAAEGEQFAELNAHQVGNLYQPLCLEPGAEISWSIYHRGRSGVDVASIGIGDNFNNVTVLETMSDGNAAWGFYSGTYTVPAETITYVVISSISSTGSNSYGNLVDGFQCTVTYDPCQDSDGDGVPDDQYDYPNDNTRAFNKFFPSNGPGTLMFEDLWPFKGDYGY